MNHIMVDIETLDTQQSAVVLSIGAVVFDPHSKALGETFYVEFTDDLASQQIKGRTISADTVRWWMMQSDAAKVVFANRDAADLIVKGKINVASRLSTEDGLNEFSHFVARNGGNKVELWGNGSDFDNVIIGSLYDSFDMIKPWSYGKNRCYRTMKRVFGENVPLVRQGVHHNGLDDAITQAVHLQEIFACVTRR